MREIQVRSLPCASALQGAYSTSKSVFSRHTPHHRSGTMMVPASSCCLYRAYVGSTPTLRSIPPDVFAFSSVGTHEHRPPRTPSVMKSHPGFTSYPGQASSPSVAYRIKNGSTPSCNLLCVGFSILSHLLFPGTGR